MDKIFAKNNFKCIFLNKKVRILNKISLKYIPDGSIDSKSALVLVMAWCQIDSKPLSELMMAKFTNPYIHYSASMS